MFTIFLLKIHNILFNRKNVIILLRHIHEQIRLYLKFRWSILLCKRKILFSSFLENWEFLYALLPPYRIIVVLTLSNRRVTYYFLWGLVFPTRVEMLHLKRHRFVILELLKFEKRGSEKMNNENKEAAKKRSLDDPIFSGMRFKTQNNKQSLKIQLTKIFF